MAGEKKTQQQQGQLQLLDFWVSPFGQRCRIALDEKGLSYTYLEQDLANKSELLLRSNPVHKKIPVLLHDGRPICESLVILQYLDDAFPATPSLLPSGAGAGAAYARAQARFWADYADKKLYDCGTRLWKLKRGGPVDGAHAQAREEMLQVLRTLEERALGDGRFFGGDDAFGFVDVVLAPFTSWFLVYERFGGLSVEEECPRLAAWAKRCAERASVAKNVYPPEKVYEFVCGMKKRLGIE